MVVKVVVRLKVDVETDPGIISQFAVPEFSENQLEILVIIPFARLCSVMEFIL